MLHLSNNLKEKKRNINIDLAILPSHNTVAVRNVDSTSNSTRVITHQVEVNVYYKDYIERMRIDICNLGKTDIILGMPWLTAHNPEIN